MPAVTIHELTPNLTGTGDHVWIEIEFSTGGKLTLRVDQYAPTNDSTVNEHNIYAAVNEGVGREFRI